MSASVYDVAVNDNGDVYAAVRGNNRIEVFNWEGKRIDDRTIGTSGDGEGQFSSPSAIAIRGSIHCMSQTPVTIACKS